MAEIKTVIALEGVLDLVRQPCIRPAECTKECDMMRVPDLVGIATTATGASNVANVERYLEMFNGKWVKVTIEYADAPVGEAAKG